MEIKKGPIKTIASVAAVVILGGWLLFQWLTVPKLTGGKGINPDKIKLVHLGKELDEYKKDCGTFPRENFNLRLLLGREPAQCSDISNPSLWSGQDASIDKWGNKIQYKVVDDGYVLTALGKDGKPGGEGEDADWIYDSVRKEVMRPER